MAEAQPVEHAEGSKNVELEVKDDPVPGAVAAASVKRMTGMAAIKPEFLDLDHKRRLATEYLPAEAAKEMEQATYSKGDQSHDSTTGDHKDGPKKKKFKGRNKKRPREQRPEAKDRLCPKLMTEEPCSFGDRCKFNHDVAGYMSSKLPDLGEKCHLFETFGKCHYGLTCRFAGQHLSENKNVVNEELYAQTRGETLTKNILSKDLQRQLWKRTYNFDKGNNILKKVVAQQKAAQNTKAVPSKDKGPNGEKVEQTSNEHGVEQCENASEPKGEPTVDVQALENPTKETAAAVESPALEQEEGNSTSAPAAAIRSPSGATTDEDVIKLRPQEKKKIDFRDKLYLAPLTTVGNLPFRRICKQYGADITCGEMALCSNLLQGQQSEWALLKRHASEDIFGVQLCGSFPDSMTRCAQLLSENIDVDFIDINCGCPIDLIYKKGEGCALMGRTNRFEQIIRSMTSVMDVPLTVKIRTGIFEDKHIAHTLLPKLRDWGASMVTVHGRSREQRYTRLADWDYINQCAQAAGPLPVYGNGDILSYVDAKLHREETDVSGLMLARGALIKPWVFTEIKEERHWDISASERLDMLRGFANYGLEHWGSDQQGIANTRRFLLEWQSFLYRYIPVGILEQPPQKINLKPPYYFGRNELETLMASPNCADWIKISEMLLGPVPESFTFLPKHKANAYR